jgi:extradiol dioxygenase family protein
MPRKSTPRRPSRSNALPWVASTAVAISDRAKAKEWYTGTLGLKVIMDTDHWITVGRKGKGGALHLCQVSELDPKAQLEPGNSGILLLLDGDFHRRCEELEARGVRFKEHPTERPWGWDATIVDPDGNELLLMSGE